MPRTVLNIKSYVTRLLGDLEPAQSGVAYGYADQRKIFADPESPGKQVVIVDSRSGTLGQPNVIEEANNYIANLAAAAKSLIDKDGKANTDQRKNAIDKCADKFKKVIQNGISLDKAIGDLFSSKKSTTNKNFLKELEKAETILRDFTQAVAKISGHTLKELDNAGHLLRSQGRSTLIHRFKAPNAKADEDQFIMYIPCGRYTERQKRLMGKTLDTPVDHDTTSHNRGKFVLGNSSMARMIVGTRYEDGRVVIQHDSFTGPGARMPYEDFKKADAYKKLAIKAITLINQEEIIQTLAQREIDRMSNVELLANIPKAHRPTSSGASRQSLIELYVDRNSISVTECYTQVVTAGQRVSAEHQREQFEYVRQMMDAFDNDGTGIRIQIQTSDTTEVAGVALYQARMSSWGVNWFRHAGRLNPLADNTVTVKQNARFINQMTRDVLADLQQYNAMHDIYPEIGRLDQLLNNPNVNQLEKEITTRQDSVSLYKREYRKELFDYYKEYAKGKDKWSQAKLDASKELIEQHERTIHKHETAIYEIHQQIEAKRKAYYLEHKAEIKVALKELATKISPLITSTKDARLKAKLQHFYNTCAYLIQAQELHYEQTWHHEKNNFKLQTVVASLAEELGQANTKGCKSNNDRGQRLAQKVAGNALWTKMSEDGLYTGEFLNHKRTHTDEVSPIEALDRELITIQTLHHTAQTGVSGGKFEVDKAGFADNGLYGKIAKLAKIKDMGPKNIFARNIKLKLGVSAGVGALAAGAMAALAILFPPAAAIVAATHFGLAAFTALLAVFTMITSYLVGTAISDFRNKRHDSRIKGIARECLQEAAEVPTSAGKLNALGGNVAGENQDAPPHQGQSPLKAAVETATSSSAQRLVPPSSTI